MSSRSKKVAGAWGPVILYAAAIFLISAQSELPRTPGFEISDKLKHFGAYFVFGLLAVRAAFIMPIGRRVSPYVQALIVGVLYGASDEYHQSFVPQRNACVYDWIADSLGVLSAVLLVAAIAYFRRRRQWKVKEGS